MNCTLARTCRALPRPIENGNLAPGFNRIVGLPWYSLMTGMDDSETGVRVGVLSSGISVRVTSDMRIIDLNLWFCNNANMQVQNHCLTCGKDKGKNPKFCSSSCAATFNNRRKPKRKKTQRSCGTCGAATPSSRHKYCSALCDPNRRDWDQTALSELQCEAKYQGNAVVRRLARKVWLSQNPEPKCACCGYSKHVEVCHIKGISAFRPSTKIATINAQTNLVGLCPNHHWEFDHGELRLPGVEPGPVV